MKSSLVLLLLAALYLISCEKEIRNIAEPIENSDPSNPQNPITVSNEVNPVDINTNGFNLLEKIQGHWVGTNMVIADEYDWFCFDYRANSPSQISGIFEGGSMGNLFTSFFVTDFKNTRTIMARNGGVLSGIYRTSYFVLDSVNSDVNGGEFYRLVDAQNGQAVMWMEMLFRSDSLYFNAYTSRLGEFLPTLHMSFKAKRENSSLAQTAATNAGFPVNTPAYDFSNGFNEAWYYENPSSNYQSATFMAESQVLDVYGLASQSGDPVTISDHPNLSSLQVDITRNAMIDNTHTFVYLSYAPLTDAQGYMDINGFNSVLYFPDVIGSQDELLFTYLHPGDYYVTVIADANGDGAPSLGDITHVSQQINIGPEQAQQITIDNITVQN